MKRVIMPKETDMGGKRGFSLKRRYVMLPLGVILTIILIIVTIDISRRNLFELVSNQEKYIIGIEAAILFILIVELLVSIVTVRSRTRWITQLSTNLRLTVRIAGYSIAAVSVIAILSSNPTLGISIGAVFGVVVALATQNMLSSVMATIFLINTRMIRVGEEITISGTRGIIYQINVTNTIISIDDEIAYIPNSLIITSIIRRKKRNFNQDGSVNDW
jgi:small-conductance mechanosensitive channel